MGCASSSAFPKHAKFHDGYRLGKKLGEGAFGQVRVARSRNGESEMAVKIIDVRSRDYGGEPTRHAEAERVKLTRSEIRVWQAVGPGEHVVSLSASYFDRNLFYMVMEKCSCSLMDKMSKMNAVMEGDLCRIFCDMLAGIKHVHEKRIVHRDIKPDNFLFGGSSGSKVKLCDFGLAAQLPKKGVLKGIYGTAPYMSPEMLSTSGYDRGTDVWSFGATAFLMIHGDFPYLPREASATAMKKCIIQNKPEIRFVRERNDSTFFSHAFVDRATPLLQALLQRQPLTRKTAAEAMQLPFFAPDEEQSIILKSEGTDDAPLAPAFRKARKATNTQMDLKPEMKQIMPIKQKNLEDLLELLQEKSGHSEAGTTFFSEGDENIEAARAHRTQTENKSEDRIHRRSETRWSTHSGVTGKKAGCIDIDKLKALDLDNPYENQTGDVKQAHTGAMSAPELKPHPAERPQAKTT